MAEVFTGPEFQSRRKALWDRRDLSFPQRMRETRRDTARHSSLSVRSMVAESLSSVLEPMGFAPGRPQGWSDGVFTPKTVENSLEAHHEMRRGVPCEAGLVAVREADAGGACKFLFSAPFCAPDPLVYG